MKALSKPLSSPGRAEKFPPPLMRFLRSNVGSRSRGRSRSSPMFYLRSRKSLPEATQEPSSPKVTCIGQVRVRRAAKSKKKKTAAATVKRRRCRWLKKTLFWGKFRWRFRCGKRPFRRMFRNWGSFFRSGYCKKVDDAAEDTFRVNSKIGKNENFVADNNHRNSSSNDSESDYNYRNNSKYENLGAGFQEISKRNFLESSSSSSSPPKNALILTRCRSAPYRSSSLGGRFWGSPLAEKAENHEADEKAEKSEELEKRFCENAVEEPRIIEENCREMEKLSEKNAEELKVNAGAVHPLVLMRCKSEPARTGERLNPEAIFLRQKRLDVVDY